MKQSNNLSPWEKKDIYHPLWVIRYRVYDRWMNSGRKQTHGADSEVNLLDHIKTMSLNYPGQIINLEAAGYIRASAFDGEIVSLLDSDAHKSINDSVLGKHLDIFNNITPADMNLCGDCRTTQKK